MVVLGGKQMTKAHKKVLEYGFNRFARDFKCSTASLYKWLKEPLSMKAGNLMRFKEQGILWEDFTDE